MTRATPARLAALSVLAAAKRRDAYVRDLLGSSDAVRALSSRDAAFARRLALGATACEGCLDEALDRWLAKPGKVSPRVRAALRLAAFELIYLGTPPEAAVSQGVELVRSQARAAAGMANAVLRRVADGRVAFLAAEDVESADRPLASRARAAGLPTWLAREIEVSLGDDAARALYASELEPAPLAVCLNPRATRPVPGLATSPSPSGTSGAAVRIPGQTTPFGRESEPAGSAPVHISGRNAVSGQESEPSATGVPPEGASLPDGCAAVSDMPALIASGALERGDAVASDANAQAVALSAVRPGCCLEIGAGRGTKTFVMAAAAARAGLRREHVALDLYEGKCRQNMERLRRAGLADGVAAVAGDATDLDAALADLDAAAGEPRLFDAVFVDAPCSGTGTMRRHPEIPWRLDPADIAPEGLPALQSRMLRQASARVRPGGLLVYATCSVLSRENGAVVDGFLSSPEGAAFTEVSRTQTTPEPGAFDGHFHAVLERRV